MKIEDRKIGIEDRVMTCFASLFFSVPTVIILWLLANYVVIGVFWFNYKILILTIGVFAILGFFFPSVLLNILGKVWGFLYKVSKWP